MLISLIKLTHIENHTLPSKVYGNYWIQDKNSKGEIRNLINIEEYNGKWKVDSNNDVKIFVNGIFQKAAILQEYCFCILKVKGENDILLYCCPKYDPSYLKYKVGNNLSATVGYLNENSIVIKNRNVSDKQILITYNDGVWQFKNLDIRVPVYVNNKIKNGGILNYGDVIFILGLKIIVMKDFVAINNPFNCVTVNNLFMPFENKAIENIQPMREDTSITVYEKDEYFYKSPRFRTFIEHEKIKIDAPPMKQEMEEQPLILTLGPMLTMSLSSLMSAAVVINNVMSGNSTWGSAIPTLVISITMIITMILWPTLTRLYRKKRKIKKEKKRQTKYKEYIELKRKNIQDVIVKQKQILIENTISLSECKNVIENRKRNLWERKPEHDDFLNVRIGIGNLEPSLDIAYPEEHFTVDEDNLRDCLNDLVKESKMIEDVPIGISLTNKKISAVVGDDLLTKKFIDGLILQTITFHSYDDVKIVLLTNEDRSENWSYIKLLPHCWSDDKQIRFFGTTPEEVKDITNYLDEELNSRINNEISRNNIEYKNYSPYYVIFIDNLKIVRSNYFIKKLLSKKENYGFSILIKNDKLSNLPNECTTFINIDKQTSGIFENELVTNKQKEFEETLLEGINMEPLAIKLANIPIETNKTVSILPKSLGFLEMFNVGKIEQLNILNRWKKNNPVISLETPVGIDGAEELIKLDLHEKFHGPHGLIAGMTGSGKSEFIITYILSMAINYSPDEVNFILIDYKGGGLAGAFENRETGLKLPHLVGTITNLDTASMRRSLASIQSELKRRQKEFNKAREQLGESTMDIYKYQKYYRDGNLNKPISHLFIISDEFAELKAQKPEFMEQLISTARIGRSLGVHLILATQKPNGVVNDQIWSNTKFRVCLKVQDKSDSTDMIKTPEAAYLKEAGRFYLQVGYNEYFVLGQSAFSGTQYRMSDKLEKKVDLSLNFIDNTGNVYKSIEEKMNNDNVKIMGEELPNIVEFLDDLAKSQNIKVAPLWLNPIPAYVNVVDLIKKYNYRSKEFILNPVIGEFDIPHNQEQRILTLPLSVEGNSIIYGAAGSGKELMLSTIMYSLIMNHSALEVNTYIIDCGAETLKMFSKAPQVGDILTSTDEEKIGNLFKFIKEEIDVRKDLFSNYNGDYSSYIKSSNSKLPNIVIIINNYESFSELYGEYEDVLLQLTRDCLKYGIIFILTASAANGVRYKLKQNFKQQIALQLNDEGEYSSVVGNTKKLYPSDIYGRGLVRIESEVYEFQTASAAPKEELSGFISNFCNELFNASTIRAQKIKVLPSFVSYDYVKDSIKTLSKVPIGVSKDTLKIATHNFNKYITLITGLDNDSFRFFVPVLSKVLSNINGIYFSLINTVDDFEVSDKIKVWDNNFGEIFKEIKEKILKLDEEYKTSGFNKDILNVLPTSVYMIYGFDKFKSRLSIEEQKELASIIEKGKELEKFKFIFIDSVDKFKKYEYEPWYKNVVSSNQGIWIGNGIENQFV